MTPAVTSQRSELAAFVLHLESVRTQMGQRVAGTAGRPTMVISIDEFNQYARDIQTAAAVLRGYHAQMIQEGKAVG